MAEIKADVAVKREVKQQSLIFQSVVIETSLKHELSLGGWLAARERGRETQRAERARERERRHKGKVGVCLY